MPAKSLRGGAVVSNKDNQLGSLGSRTKIAIHRHLRGGKYS